MVSKRGSSTAKWSAIVTLGRRWPRYPNGYSLAILRSIFEVRTNSSSDKSSRSRRGRNRAAASPRSRTMSRSEKNLPSNAAIVGTVRFVDSRKWRGATEMVASPRPWVISTNKFLLRISTEAKSKGRVARGRLISSASQKVQVCFHRAQQERLAPAWIRDGEIAHPWGFRSAFRL